MRYSSIVMLRAIAIWVLVFILLGIGLTAQVKAGCTTQVSLTKAIDGLEKQGLKIIYTSELIKPWMMVRSIPDDASQVKQLRSILKPYSLSIERGPNRYWLVVRNKKKVFYGHGALSGRVLGANGHPILVTALIKVLKTDYKVETDLNGCYFIYGMSSGEYDVQISAEGYHTKLLPRLRIKDYELHQDVKLHETSKLVAPLANYP